MAKIRKIGLDAIAARAGVSKSCVSLALSGTGRIGQETRDKIRRIARDMGYDPQPRRDRLRRNSVGVVLDRRFLWPDEEYFMPIVRGVEQAAAARGLRTMFSPVDPSQPGAAAALRAQAALAGAWILVGVTQPAFTAALAALGRPMVMVACGWDDSEASDTVLNDDMGAMRAAVNHLAELGHRKVAFIGGEHSNLSALERWRGFRIHAEERLSGLDTALVDTDELLNTPEGGRRACARLLARRRDFTAVVCATDDLAWGALEELAARGISVPRQVSVVGCDGKSHSARTRPPLTTVCINREQMGSMALEVAASRLHQAAFTHPLRVLVGSDLVVRASTAPPAGPPARRRR